MTIKTLKPNDSHKSFYGKAKVIWDEEGYTLYSYSTPVIRLNLNGKVVRLWHGYSATTMRHVNAFMAEYYTRNTRPGISVGGKAWWDKMPVFKAVYPDEV